MVRPAVQCIEAEQQNFIADAVQYQPFDRLRAVLRIAVLFIGSQCYNVPFFCITIRKRRVGIQKGFRSRLGIRISAEIGIKPVGRPGITDCFKRIGPAVIRSSPPMGKEQKTAEQDQEHGKHSREPATGVRHHTLMGVSPLRPATAQ